MSQKDIEGGTEPVVVPIITPTTVHWLLRLISKLRRTRRSKEKRP